MGDSAILEFDPAQLKPAPLQAESLEFDPSELKPAPPASAHTLKPGPEPGFWERVKGAFIGSPQQGDTPIGRAVGQSFEAPSEKHVPTTELPMVRASALAPEITKTVVGAIPGVGPALAETSIGKGIGEGVATAAEGLTTAPNLLMAAGSGGFGLLGQVSKLLPRVVSGAFTVQMLHQAYEEVPAFKQAWDSGDPKAIAKAVTEMAVTLGMAGAAGTHAARGGGEVASKEPPPLRIPKGEPVQVRQTAPEILEFSPEELKPAPAPPEQGVIQPKPSEVTPERAGAAEVPEGGNKITEIRPTAEVPVAEPQPSQPARVGGSPSAVPALPELASDRVPSPPQEPGVRELPEVDRGAAGAPEEKAKIEIPRAKDLRPEEREAETRYIEKIQADPEAVINKYREANTKESGTLTINTDNARELSDDYSASKEGRTAYARAVHEPSSWVAKEVYKRALKEPAPDGTANVVAFTGGGTGAGKSVASELFNPDNPPQIVYDTNLNDFESAVKKFDQALNAGKNVDEYFIDRGILPSFESMLHRATRMGRPVPIENHIETHMGAAKTTLALIEHYKDDPRVNIMVVDNNGGSPSEAKFVSPDTLKGREYNGVREILEQAADQAYADGRISAEVYRAVRGKSPEVARGGVPERPAALRVQTEGRGSDRARYGRPTEILIPGSPKGYQAVYSIRELGDVQASHSGQTFQANPKYEATNDRDYSDKRNSGRVLEQAGDFKPQYLLTDSPDALNGAPIIDSRGNVLGGNSRTMTLDRVYAQRPASAAHYRSQLAAKAKEFGIDPEALRAMKRPVLVRELQGEFSPQKAVTDFNVAGTAALTPAERAVADSHRVSVQTLNEVARRIEDQGPDGTLAKALAGDGRALVNRLVEDGAVAAQDKPALLNPDGTFSAEGKSRLSRLLIGRLFEDSKQFDTTAPELRNKLERIVAPLARVEGKDEWDIGPTVKQAIGLINEAKARDVGIDDLLAQTGMFEQSEYSPAAVAVAKSLAGKATEVAKAFRNYAEEAEMATTGTEAGIEPGLLTAKIPTQLEAFNEAFKADLTEPIETTPKSQAVEKPAEKIGEPEKIQVGQKESLPEPWQISKSEVVPYADTVPKPKYKPESKGGYSEEELNARSIRNRAAETEPPEVNRFPIGTWRLDSTGELSQLRRLSLDDKRLIFPEELPNQRNQTVQKYVDWMGRTGEASPPVTALETDKGSIKISDGHHRVAAIKARGGDSVDAWVTVTRNVKRPSGAVMPEGLTHEQAVRTAIDEGRDVPKEVLADYPDLKQSGKEESKPEQHDKSSTQANLPPDMAEKVRAAAAKIPDSELADKGREEEPHVTVLYGTETDNPADVAKLMEGERPIKAKIGAMSIFPGKNGEPDVVKLDVDSTDLRRLNAKINKNLPNANEHPQYKPHVTLAYVENGKGAKYAGRAVPGLSGKEVTLDSVQFSPRSGEKTEIPLGEKTVQAGQAETPETKPSRLAQGVEEKAIANKLTQGFEGKPEYQAIKVEDQARMAADLIKGDPEKAVRIAMGQEQPPEGLLPESVFVAMEDYATKNKDVELLRDLATTSTLSSEATGMGQRIRMLAERDPNSAVAAIQKVVKAREEAAAKRFGPKAKDTIKAQIKIEIKKANAKPKDWISFIQDLTCK